MSNILDYLDWRGDITIEISPFNEVDNLLLSELAYVPFDKILPEFDEKQWVTIKEAAEKFFAKYDLDELCKNHSLMAKAPLSLKKMAESVRFAMMRLCFYVNQIDKKKEKQFSAMTVECGDGTYFVAFRGTDDTLVGWKEDFNMSYISVVPSQLEAVNYVEHIAENVEGMLRLGGHSKGGNLAVYASVQCKDTVRERILEVYNNDGPGFSKEMLGNRRYMEMKERIRTIVPQSSVVGMILEHEEDYFVTKSSQSGLMQHDPLSWEVLGTGFVYLQDLDKESHILDKTLKNWISNMSYAERENFVMALFHILDGTGAKNLSDLSEERFGNIGALVKTVKIAKSMSKEDQEMMINVIRALIKAYKDVVLQEYLPDGLRKKEKKNS